MKNQRQDKNCTVVQIVSITQCTVYIDVAWQDCLQVEIKIYFAK